MFFRRCNDLYLQQYCEQKCTKTCQKEWYQVRVGVALNFSRSVGGCTDCDIEVLVLGDFGKEEYRSHNRYSIEP